jgi:hypothetical protein
MSAGLVAAAVTAAVGELIAKGIDLATQRAEAEAIIIAHLAPTPSDAEVVDYDGAKERLKKLTEPPDTEPSSR